jgi:hypothetical protein
VTAREFAAQVARTFVLGMATVAAVWAVQGVDLAQLLP